MAVSIRLFDLLTRPSVQLKEAWSFGEQDPKYEVEWDLDLMEHDDYELLEAWKMLFQPNLAEYAKELMWIVAANLTATSGLMQQCRPECPADRLFWFKRQSIEHADEHESANPFDILVDAAIEILCNLLESHPKRAAALIEMWFDADPGILRRIAMFGYGKRKDIASDEKIQWLLNNHLVYSQKTDVFGFLENCYGAASDEVKARFVRTVLEGPRGEEFDRVEPTTIECEVFNFLVWLAQIAPDCAMTRAKLQELQAKHPEFKPREHPELDFWSESGVISELGTEFDSDLIASRPASEFLDRALSWKPQRPMMESGYEPFVAVSKVVSKHPEWGHEWLRAVTARNLRDDNLWRWVCEGWRDASLGPAQWTAVLNLVESIEAPAAFFEAFASVLHDGARKEQNKLPDELMGQAQRIAVRIWELALEATGAATATEKDWLACAINKPGGKLAEFWLHRTSVARKTAGESWPSFPQDIARSLAVMLRSAAEAGAHVRIVFASQLHYFFALDSRFTETELLPLFDWKTDELRAEQCWQGFFWWGRWAPGLTAKGM